MAFATTALRYGWAALASLGILTGTTIYVINNQRHQVKPQDIIELALGTHERCFPTLIGTNVYGVMIYGVALPSFVRTWTSNYFRPYTTNVLVGSNVVIVTNWITETYTNVVTNVIGWHVDRDMMIDLDSTMKQLPPYYTTNPPGRYTNAQAGMTVTGIFAELPIGDSTNQFTRSPCWTNQTITNWIVNYTSYYPFTNGTFTNICYTSDFQQVVNYATNYTLSNGTWGWMSSSNWQSYVTNVVSIQTFGDYSWQVYPEDLQERYKFLWELQRPFSNLNDTAILANTDHAQTGGRRGVTVTFSYSGGDIEGGNGMFSGVSDWQKAFGTRTASYVNGQIASAANSASPSYGEMYSIAEGNWGVVTNCTVDSGEVTIVDYCEGTGQIIHNSNLTWSISCSSTTNTTPGARKIYDQSESGPVLAYWIIGFIGWQYFYHVSGSRSIYVESGNEYDRFHFTNLTEFALSNKLFTGIASVVIAGNDGGGTMPVDVTDDAGGGVHYPTLRLSDSPKQVYSNYFTSLMEISAGNLVIPTVAGTNIYTITKSASCPKSVVGTEFWIGETNFHYCTDKYW